MFFLTHAHFQLFALTFLLAVPIFFVIELYYLSVKTLWKYIIILLLFIKCGFNYVLLGALQSDPIEEHFGWFRQSHGGNYYISVRQLYDNERKIRAHFLTKFSIADENSFRRFDHQDNIDLQTNDLVDEINESFSRFQCPIPDERDINAIFYVSGALCKS